MAVDGSGAYLPPKKPKKRKPRSSGGSSSGGSSSSYSVSDSTPRGYGSSPSTYTPPSRPAYDPPTYYPPRRSSSSPAPTPTYRAPKPNYAEPQAQSFTDLLGDLTQGRERRAQERREKLTDTTPKKSEKTNFSDLLSVLSADLEDKSKGQERSRPRNPLVPGGEAVAGGLSGDQKLIDSIQSIAKKQSSNRMPLGQEISMPDRYMHKGKKNRNPLSWEWDQETIEANLDGLDDFNRMLQMSRIMDARYKDKEAFAFDITQRRAERIDTVLSEAQDQLAQEGNVDWLQNYMEKHPKFTLEPRKFREDYGITSATLLAEKRRKMAAATSDEERERIAESYSGYAGSVDTYNEIEDTYAFNYERVNKRVKKWEQFYNDQVDDRDIKDAGPAIPDPVEVKTGRDKETQEFIDDSVDDKLAFFYLGKKGANKLRQSERETAKGVLGVKHLPSLRQMLTMQVNAGLVDPDNEKDMFDMIGRLRNPAHPDTRAMYVSMAMKMNPDLEKSGKDLVGWINAPYKDYLERSEKVAETSDKRKRTAEAIDYHERDYGDADDNPLTKIAKFTGDALSDAGNDILKGGFRGGYSDYIEKGDLSETGSGFLWTMDKLLRFNYAVAGGADAFFKLDQDEPWTNAATELGQNMTIPGAAVFSFLGANPLNSVDELVSNPVESLGKIKQASGEQFFRGIEGLEDVTPITFDQVIANNAERNPENNVFDEEWYQRTVGFVADVGLDPTTYIGVGFLAGGARVALKGSLRGGRSLADEAVAGGSMINEYVGRKIFGDLYGNQRAMKRAMDRKVMDKGTWVSRISNPSFTSREAQNAWRVRQVVNGKAGNHTTDDFLSTNDIPPLGENPRIDEIVDQVSKLSRLQNARNSDLASGAMREHVRNHTTVMSDFTPEPGMSDLRQELLARTGNWFKIEQRIMEDVSAPLVPLKGSKGGIAAKAQRELDALEDSIKGTGSEGSEAFTKRADELRKTISDNSKQGKKDIESYLDEGADISEHAKTIRSGIAKAIKRNPEDVPFTDEELVLAATRGRDLLRNSSPENRARVDTYFAQLKTSQKKIAKAKATGNTSLLNRATMSMNDALHNLGELNSAGIIRYLHEVERMGPAVKGPDGTWVRGNTKPVYENADAVTNLRGIVDELDERSLTTDIKSNTGTKNYAREDDIEVGPDEFFKGTDFNQPLDDIIASGRDKYTETTIVEALKREANRQIKAQRLDAGGRIKRLPNMETAKLKTAAPRQFLDENGEVSAEKLLERVHVKNVAVDTRYARHAVTYDAKGLGREGTAFLRNFAMSLKSTFNDLYRERNLAAKADQTGYGVTARAKHILDPKDKTAERVVVAVGTRDFKGRKYMDAAMNRKNTTVHATDNVKGQDFKELSSTLRDIQRIHQTIKAADEAGKPPVLYVFNNFPLNHSKSRYIRDTIAYARMRGVTVTHFEAKGFNKPVVTNFHGADRQTLDKELLDFAKTNLPPLRSKFPNSHWSRLNQEFEGPQELMEASLGDGFIKFYEANLTAGSPLNWGDAASKLIEIDDVVKERLATASDEIKDTQVTPKQRKGQHRPETSDTSDSEVIGWKGEDSATGAMGKGSVEVPGPIMFRGKKLDTNIAKARNQIEAVLKREDPDITRAQVRSVTEPLVKEYAEKLYRFIEAQDVGVQFKMFNNVYSKSVRTSKASKAAEAGDIAAAAKYRLEHLGDELHTVDFDLGPGMYKDLVKKTLDDSVAKLIDEINGKGTLPDTVAASRTRFETPKTDDELWEEASKIYGPALVAETRRTVNESYRDAAKQIKAEYNSRKIDAEIRLAEAANKDEAAAVSREIASLIDERSRLMKELEWARVQALQAKTMLNQDEAADAIIQLTYFPDSKLSEAELRQLVAAKKADLEMADNHLNAAEIAADATPHKWYQNMSDTFKHLGQGAIDAVPPLGARALTRPSKQLTTDEAREILALVTGATPIIVKSDLKRITDRMGGVVQGNREAIFTSLRMNSPYMGAQPHGVQGIKEEMDEIEAIFNHDHSMYQFPLEGRNTMSFVTWNDLGHWLPEGFMPDLKVLGRLAQKRKNGKVTIEDIFNAIPSSKRSKHAFDPAVFAHNVRVAAGQARHVRVASDNINRTFGVARYVQFEPKGDQYGLNAKIEAVAFDPRSRRVEGLSKLGWETIDELGNTHYFHPAVVKEIKSIVRLINDKDSRTQFGKWIDAGISGWKGLQTTYSPPYYVRNIVGEGLMAWLGGVHNPKYFGRSLHAMKWIANKDRDLAELVAKLPQLQGVIPVDTASGKGVAAVLKGGQKISYEDAWRLYALHGLKSTFTNTEIRAHGARAGAGALLSDRKTVRNIKKGFNKLHDGGEMLEDYPRFAHFLHALEHSGKANLDASARYAAQRVRKYHFDYSDVSNFEKLAVGRALPFFKWTRFAAPVMLQHMFLTPGRVTAPMKALDASAGMLGSQDVHEDTNGHLPDYEGMAPAWVRDLMAYQVAGAPGSDDGYATYIRMAVPQTDALLAAFQPDDASMGLLNPFIKSTIELIANRGIDPDFGKMQILGGDFNEMYNINNLEALAMYGARQAGPFAKTAADLYRGSQTMDNGESYNDYREGAGYDKWKQLVSNLSGVNVYQAKPGDPANAVEDVPEFKPPASAVGTDDLLLRGQDRGRKAVSTPASDVSDGLPSVSYGDQGGSGWVDFGRNNGWVDFPDFQWRDFGNGFRNFGGFGGGGFGGGFSSGGSSSVSRSEWADNLLELIQALKADIDQGDVQ